MAFKRKISGPLLLLALSASLTVTLAGCSGQLIGTGEEADGQAGEETAETALSEADLAAVEGYSEEESDLMALLAANRWSDDAGEHALVFDADTNIVSDIASADGEPSTFVIRAMADEQGSRRLVVSIDGELYSAFLAQGEAMGDEAASDSALTVYGWNGSARCLREPAQQKLKVTGTPEWLASFGVEASAVDAAVASYVQEGYPAVTEASCDGTASVDDEEAQVALGYSLNDSSGTSVEVTCSTETGAVLSVG